MLMNDYDEDEYSLDEEEEDMESSESVTSELNDLQREGEMPLNKVLAMYKDSAYENTLQEVPEGGSDSSADPALEIHSSSQSDSEEDRKLFEVIDLISPNATPTKSRPLLRSVHPQQSESDSDCDYSPGRRTDHWRKKIQVGSDHQAVVPPGLSRYDDAPPYENEDRLLWDPAGLADGEVEDYLRRSRRPRDSGVDSVPTGAHLRDDEGALFLLLQCGHNREEALRRRGLQTPSPGLTVWSEEECRGFESGLKAHGKNFRQIQLERVRTRAVGELVQFYYFWKRTERHDMFACRNRIQKKKYALHPGATDYMDRFLEEQERENARLCSGSARESAGPGAAATEADKPGNPDGPASTNGDEPLSSGLDRDKSL